MKSGFNFGQLTAGAHPFRRCPVTQQHAQGVDNNRFAGAGFTGENIQPWPKHQV